MCRDEVSSAPAKDKEKHADIGKIRKYFFIFGSYCFGSGSMPDTMDGGTYIVSGLFARPDAVTSAFRTICEVPDRKRYNNKNALKAEILL